jgi:hypothetical protein
VDAGGRRQAALVGNRWNKPESDRSADGSHRNCGPLACSSAKDYPRKIKIRTTPPADGLKAKNRNGLDDIERELPMPPLHSVIFGIALTWTPAHIERLESPKDFQNSDMTETQVQAVQMTAIARFAGTKGVCPWLHFIERAAFAEWVDAKIPEEIVGTTNFENVETVALLSVFERQRKNPSDFCIAAWKLFGPKGLYHRHLLEAN